MSSLTAAKYLKHLTRFSESEIMEGVGKFSQKEQETIEKLAKRLSGNLETVDTTKLKRPAKKRKRATDEEIFVQMLAGIEYSLCLYESEDHVDE